MSAVAVRYADRCGVICQELDLSKHLDERAAAWLVICSGRCVVLHAPAEVTWTAAGVMTLAWRIAGRVPSVLDELPPHLADELAAAMLKVLDFAGAA